MLNAAILVAIQKDIQRIIIQSASQLIVNWMTGYTCPRKGHYISSGDV